MQIKPLSSRKEQFLANKSIRIMSLALTARVTEPFGGWAKAVDPDCVGSHCSIVPVKKYLNVLCLSFLIGKMERMTVPPWQGDVRIEWVNTYGEKYRIGLRICTFLWNTNIFISVLLSGTWQCQQNLVSGMNEFRCSSGKGDRLILLFLWRT